MYRPLQVKIIEWAKERNLIQQGNPRTQTLKLVSEIGELADAIIRLPVAYNMDFEDKDAVDVMDAIGDIHIVLINLCAILKIDPIDCIEFAFQQIADRQGTIIHGNFVKDSKK
jgi:NTP pyrophosphatase (non-canonical NTP hydrolase)